MEMQFQTNSREVEATRIYAISTCVIAFQTNSREVEAECTLRYLRIS